MSLNLIFKKEASLLVNSLSLSLSLLLTDDTDALAWRRQCVSLFLTEIIDIVRRLAMLTTKVGKKS